MKKRRFLKLTPITHYSRFYVKTSWACLHQWLEAQHQNPTCPVCKAGCAQDKVIPIYGRGKEQLDPRYLVPRFCTLLSETTILHIQRKHWFLNLASKTVKKIDRRRQRDRRDSDRSRSGIQTRRDLHWEQDR